jgi:hypothetical protein
VTGSAPRPLLCDGVVTIDSRARALTVRPAADASATAKLLWRDGVRAQARADSKTVWANGAGESRVAFGLPTADNALEFRFHVGDPVYRELVSSPGLHARIAVDRANPRTIIGVTFRAR